MRETHGTDVTRGASGASGDILSHVIHVPKEKVPGVKGPGSVWLREHPPLRGEGAAINAYPTASTPTERKP